MFGQPWDNRGVRSCAPPGIHKYVPVFMDRLLPRVQHLFNAIGVGPNYTVRKNWFIYDSPRDQYDLFQPEDEAVKHG